MWEGFGLHGWLRLLWRNRFAVHPRYWWVAAIVMVVSTVHSICWLLQEAFWRHRIVRTPMPTDPVFILGHWRTGTTFLHELLIRDPRHTYPNMCQCMEPNCFLMVENFMRRFMPFVLPKRRPMDDLPTGWDRPQEDEFALCMMGQPSFYTHIAFPNHRPTDFDALDFRGFSDEQQSRWGKALAWFLQRVSYVNPGKRLILKSPPHMARIPALLRQFPNARFVHICRDPYRVYPSTLRLWKALSVNHTLQVPDDRLAEEVVSEAGRRLYAAYEIGKKQIPAGRLCELRYEDLMANPLAEIERIYRSLELGDFNLARPAVAQYLAEHRDYQPNASAISDDVKAKVDHTWPDIVKEVSYSAAVTSMRRDPLPPLADTLSTNQLCTT